MAAHFLSVDQVTAEYADTAAIAKRTGFSKFRYERWRTNGDGGPPYYKFDQKVLYKISEVEDWMQQHRCVPASIQLAPGGDAAHAAPTTPRPWE